MKQQLPIWWRRVWLWIRQPPHYYVVLLVIAAIATHLQWFNFFSTLEFGDWEFRPDESVREMLTSWNTWVPFERLGGVNILMSSFPIRGLAWGLVTRIGFTYDIATKLTLFLPVALGAFLLPFMLGRRLFKDDKVAFLTALFYGSTTYFLILQTAHVPIALIYVLLPLLVYLLDKALDENKWRHWLSLTLLFCVGIFYEVRMMYVIGGILAAYFLCFLFTRRVHIKYYLKHIAACGVVLLLLNLFWMIPTKLAAGQSIGEVAGRGLFGNALFNMLQSMTIMKWDWTGAAPDSTFTAQIIPGYLWIVPVLVAVSLVAAGRFRKRLLFFLTLTVVGLILTKQSAEPFSGLYHWLYLHFPGFVLFREASKLYVLVAFGYFGILGYGLVALKDVRQKIGRWQISMGFVASAALLLLVAFVNLRPALTTQIGGTFKNAQMPEDYKVLKRFLATQPDYFRVYWVPRESWWGFYDDAHPRVRSVDALEKEWRPLLDSLGSDHGYDLAKANIDIFSQPYSENLFANSTIKYVVVPLRDQANKDDFFPYYGDSEQFYKDQLDKISFLQRVQIGTQHVAVYQNMHYRPYISATNTVYAVPDSGVLSDKLSVLAAHFSKDFSVTSDPNAYNASRAGNGLLQPLFDPSTPGLVDHQKLTQKLHVPANSELYIDQQAPQLSYQVTGGVFQLSSMPFGGLKINGHTSNGNQSPTIIGRSKLAAQGTYYVGVGDHLASLDISSGAHNLGKVSQAATLYSQTSQRNLIPNPSLEDGLWQKQVGDCNNYDTKGQLGMRLNDAFMTDGKQSLQLAASNHTACTGQQQIGVQPGATYLWAFDYQNEGGQKAGYKLTFNDAAHTTVQEDLTLTDQDWHTLLRSVSVPQGATSVDYEVYGYPDESHSQNSLTRYDRFSLVPLQNVLKVSPDTQHTFSTLPLTPGETQFIYQDSAFPLTNLIPNPSLEDGLWQKQVGDCNNYDKQADIGMRQTNEASDGKKALQLEAAKHIACTGPDPIAVKPSSTYLFSFDYQSPNAETASYYLRFDDPAKTVKREIIQLKDTKWHHYTTSVVAPPGATHVSLTLYASPNSYSNEKVAVRYDAFQLIETPSVLQTYYVVTQPTQHATVPHKVDYEIVGPTKKLVHIQGATGPFYLTQSDGYHADWKLEANNSKASGPINTWWPLVHPDAIAANQQIKLNDFQNAWYVDPANFCHAQAVCHQNSDGSYDIEMIMEFAPQRWFVSGSIISGITFIGATGYLMYDHRRRVLQGRRV
ncbi:MAG TPA: glycosyltransferase family 39 protein [Candidatus Saccharimonadales bacterium]|nr:glycosyltransferase family 39 protein [Candidatus Saccharimonadales bacterium]